MEEQIDARATALDRPYWVAAVREARAALAEASARLVEAENEQRGAVTTSLETALVCLRAATTSARFALADARDGQRPVESDPAPWQVRQSGAQPSCPEIPRVSAEVSGTAGRS